MLKLDFYLSVRTLKMWGLIRKDLGEFVSTIKDDAAGTIMSAMSLGAAEEEYESSVRRYYFGYASIWAGET